MSELIYSRELKFGQFKIYDQVPQFKCLHVHQVHSKDIVTIDELEKKVNALESLNDEE